MAKLGKLSKKTRKPKMVEIDIDLDPESWRVIRKVAKLAAVTVDQAISVILSLQLTLDPKYSERLKK